MRSLLLSLVLAGAAAAQPSAADSALVHDVLDAARLGSTMQDMMGMMGSNLPGEVDDLLDIDAIGDAVEAQLLADVRPVLLREALAYYRSPGYTQTLEIAARRAEELQRPGAFEAFQAQILNPKKGAVADEALARRYAQASGMREMFPEMMRRMFLAMAEAVPEMAAELDAAGGIDAVLAQMEGEVLATIDSTQVNAMRVGLVGYPEELLQTNLAYMESEAGLYIRNVTMEATLDVMIPRVVGMLAGIASAFEEETIEEIEFDETPPPMTPPPPMPPAPPRGRAQEPGVFDVVDTAPTLIGGLEGLQARVHYPEEARRADIEGQVVVQFIVGTQGQIENAEVVRSPSPLLSDAALAAVLGSRFTPGKQDGRAVRVRFAIPITFRLRDAEPSTTDG